MPSSSYVGPVIRGIACALPGPPVPVEHVVDSAFRPEDVRRACAMVGTKTVHHAAADQTAADLCHAAAERLLERLGWNRDSVDGLLFVSQTPDHFIPATAFLLHQRLGLPRHALVLDVNLGCSGYVHGLWLAGQFLVSGACRRVLVLVGDTISKTVSKQDRSVAVLFGDAGSATGLEYSATGPTTSFVSYAQGSAAGSITIPAGGFRLPRTESTARVHRDEEGNARSAEHLYMNGMGIFLFSLRELPELLAKITEVHGWQKDEVDYYLLHQANRTILEHIAKQAGLPAEKVPISTERYGNTSGASIPLLICDHFADGIGASRVRVVMAGFGSGLSWGGIATEFVGPLCLDIFTI